MSEEKKKFSVRVYIRKVHVTRKYSHEIRMAYLRLIVAVTTDYIVKVFTNGHQVVDISLSFTTVIDISFE